MAETATVQMIIDARAAKAGATQFSGASDRVARSAGRASKSVDRTNKSVQNLSTSLKSGTKLVLGFFGAFTAVRLVNSTIRVVADFGDQIKTLGFITQSTGETLDKLRRTALATGAATRFSTTEAADALIFLARTGFDADEAIAALPSTLNLAQTGLLDLGTAADLASNVVKQFNLTAADTERVVDAIFNVTNRTNTNVIQLGQAMKFAGPIAGALDLEVEELAASLGLLGDRGIQASMAGTNMRAMMLSLVNPTAEAIKQLEDMHLTVGEVSPAYNELTDVFSRLAAAELDVEKAGRIFTRRAAAAALILSKNVDAVVALIDAQERNRGETKKGAEEMDKSLKGALFAVRSAWEALKLSMLESEGTFNANLRILANTIRILAGIESAATKADKTARLLAEGVRFLRSAILALIAVKLVVWLRAAIATTALYAGTLRLLRVTTLSAALAQGAFATATTVASGALRILALTVRSLFAAIGPAGWLIIGVGIAIEAFIRWRGSTNDLTKSLASMNVELQGMQKFLVEDLPGATKQLERLGIRLLRNEDTEDLQGQIFALRQTRDLIEKLFEDFSLESKMDVDQLIPVTALVEVMELAGGESALAFLREAQRVFDQSPEGVKFRTSTFAAPPRDSSNDAAILGLLGLDKGPVDPTLARAFPQPLAPQDTTRTFTKASADMVRLTALLEALGKTSDATTERIEVLTKALEEQRAETDRRKQKEIIEAVIGEIQDEHKILTGAIAAFDKVIASVSQVDKDVLAEATRQAADAQEILTAKINAQAEAEKKLITLDKDFLDNLEEEIKKVQALRNAHEDVVETLKEEIKVRELAKRKHDAAVKSLDSLVEGLENENERLILSISLLKETVAVRTAAVEALRAEQMVRGENIENLDATLARIKELVKANVEMKSVITESTKKQKEAASGATKLFEELQRESELMFRTNNARQRAIRLVKFQTAAAKEYGKGTEKAAEATETYLLALDKLQKLERIKELAEGLGEAFSEAAADFLTGAGTIEEVLEGLIRQLSELVLQTQLIEPLFTNISGGFGNLFGAKGLQEGIAGSALPEVATIAQQTATIAASTPTVAAQTATIAASTQTVAAMNATIAIANDTIAVANQQVALVTISTPLVTISAGVSVGAMGMGVGAHGRLTPFAQGGFARVVNSPEFFPLGGNRTGLRGEAGPEIVAPAVRLPNGRLGIEQVAAQGQAPIIDNRTFNFNFPDVRDVDGFRRSERQIVSRLRRLSNPRSSLLGASG